MSSTTDHRSVVRRAAQLQSASRPVVTPLHTSVVYRSTDPDQLDAHYEGHLPGYTYAREGHPNATILADKIDWLEGMTPEMGGGVVTGSGMAAISAVFLGLLEEGDHIVAGNQLYGRCLRLLERELPRMGFAATLADPTDVAAMEQAIRPETRMIFVEVVSNPTIRVADMEGIAKLASERNLILVVDNTFTTPRAYQPFAHGADVIVHSVTKLLAGHSDATLGYVAARTPDMNRALYDAVVTWGLNASPFDCWLAERGLHSFDLRFAQAQRTASALADALSTLSNVERVLYPARPDHPDHNRAHALFGDNCGNMVSFCLAGGRPAAKAFVQAAEHIPFAPTLGDIGTTLSHPPSSSHRGLTHEAREALGITEGFIRVSVGVEDTEQLVGEITRAVAAAA